MTDNEIIKAFDCCKNGNCDEDCPFFFDRGNCYNLDDYVLDLINRQQAEIEKVKPIHNSFERELECAKQEAIKEFAERLKERMNSLEWKADTARKTLPIEFVKKQIEWILKDVSIETIDNLVQEMVGDDHETL